MRIPLVIDASASIKWVIQEKGTSEAIRLRSAYVFVAPENILVDWVRIISKKVGRGEITRGEARLIINILRNSDIEFVSNSNICELANSMAIDLDLIVDDCFYIALAMQRRINFVVTEWGLIRRFECCHYRELQALCIPLYA